MFDFNYRLKYVEPMDLVYAYFQEHNSKNLSTFKAVCKAWRKISQNCELFISLAKFISENHKITAQSSAKSGFFWLDLKNCHVILLGEYHTSINHRQLHANVIHNCWKGWESFKKALFTESPHITQTGQVKFLDSGIINQSRSWDLDNSEARRIWDEYEALPKIFIEYQNLCHNAKRNVYELLMELKNALHIFIKEIKNFEHIPQYIHNSLKNLESYLQNIFRLLITIDDSKTTHTERAFLKKRVKAQFVLSFVPISEFLRLLLEHFVIEKSQRLLYLSTNPKRNDNLLKSIYNAFEKDYKVVLIAGQKHTTDCSVISSLRLKKSLRFVSLSPVKKPQCDETGYLRPYTSLEQCKLIFDQYGYFGKDYSSITFKSILP